MSNLHLNRPVCREAVAAGILIRGLVYLVLDVLSCIELGLQTGNETWFQGCSLGYCEHSLTLQRTATSGGTY